MELISSVQGNPNSDPNFWSGESVAIIDHSGEKIDQSYLFITQNRHGQKISKVLAFEILINKITSTHHITEILDFGKYLNFEGFVDYRGRIKQD